MMSNDILEGNWMEVRGQVRDWWGRLTEDELDQIQGCRKELARKLQERYGYTHSKAEDEIRQFEYIRQYLDEVTYLEKIS